MKQPSFYKMTFTIVLPIIFQNLMDNAVASVDVFMLGLISQTALSASALANQLFQILSFVFFGVASGASILAAQYWGKKECRTIEKVLGLSLKVALYFAILFAVPAFFFPKKVMLLYTNDQELIEAGAVYLRLIAVTYLLSGFSQMYLNIQRSVERVRLSTIVMTASLLINTCLNACFIFGIGFFPKLGLPGVAIATVISRIFEVTICILDSLKQKQVRIRIEDILKTSNILVMDFIKYSLPVIGNNVVASVGWSMYSVIMGHLGSDVVAANSVAVVARNFGTTFCFGMTSGCLIILGRTLGENELALAKEYAGKFLKLAVSAGIFGMLLVMAFGPAFMKMGHLTAAASSYLKIMLFINAYYVMGMAMNSMWISAIFRAGGDTKYGFLCDTLCIWGFMIPIGFFLAFVLHLPAIWVYFFLMLDEFVKMPFNYYHYRKKGWLKNITREEL